jgi:hypothetical protein
MVLKDIMAISGESGLFKFIAQGKNSIVVEHLETKKRSSAFGSAKVSSLEEISVFTEKEDMPLSKVFDLIFEKENGGPAPDHKSDPEKLKSYLNEVLPSYDKEKVYVSDIRKLVHWYNILHSLGMLVKEEPEKPVETSGEAIAASAQEPEEKEQKPAGEVPQVKKRKAGEKAAPARKRSTKTKEKE